LALASEIKAFPTNVNVRKGNTKEEKLKTFVKFNSLEFGFVKGRVYTGVVPVMLKI